MNRYLLTLIFSLFFIAGCGPRKDITPATVISSKQKTYEIVDINPPKSFKVDVRDVETGYVYKSIYVSHHCNEWRKLKLGSRWYFTEVVYQGKNSNYVVVEGIKTKLCTALKRM